MAVVGDSRMWASAFHVGLIPKIVELVLACWDGCEKPKGRDKEVPITRRFRVALVLRKNALRDLPVRIERESVEDDLETAEERGRIDLRFTEARSCREDVYFAFECNALAALGVEATAAQVAAAIRATFPSGTVGVDEGEVIRRVYQQIRARNSTDNVRG